MKAATLRMLVGVTAPLILTVQASAEFLGIKVVGKPNAFGLIVCNLYAVFDRPGEDSFHKVAGTPNAPLLIQVEGGGTFYNHLFGNDNAPSPALVAAFPSLAFDSFVTIGKKDSTGDTTLITPGWPVAGVSGSSLFTNQSGWTTTPLNPQANPFDAANSFPGNGQILFAQFATADGTGFSGTLLTGGISNGVSQSWYGSFFHVPGPGALWLLGAMGLLGSRRRR